MTDQQAAAPKAHDLDQMKFGSLRLIDKYTEDQMNKMIDLVPANNREQAKLVTEESIQLVSERLRDWYRDMDNFSQSMRTQVATKLIKIGELANSLYEQILPHAEAGTVDDTTMLPLMLLGEDLELLEPIEEGDTLIDELTPILILLGEVRELGVSADRIADRLSSEDSSTKASFGALDQCIADLDELWFKHLGLVKNSKGKEGRPLRDFVDFLALLFEPVQITYKSNSSYLPQVKKARRNLAT